MKQAQTSTALPEGRILNGRYRIWQKLGGGGFGLTYLATVRDAPVQGGLVVIKEHFPSWCATRDTVSGAVCVNEGEETRYEWSLDAFKHEAQQLSILNHPNIIRVTDAFEENNTAYYVMPYVRGGSLADGVNWLRRKEQRLSQAAVLKLMRTLLSALDHMHQCTLRGVPVYHLDIKPGNILLSSNGIEELPVLIDFGSPEMGSPGFMPHEQRSPEKIGPWTDIYALAASMHKLLTGRTPASHLDDECVPLQQPPQQALLSRNEELLACYDYELLESIDRALSWEPSQRFNDAAQWLRILDSIPLRLPDHGVDLLRLMMHIRTNELVAPVALWDAEEKHGTHTRGEWMRNLAIFLASAGAASFVGLALLMGGGDDEDTLPRPMMQNRDELNRQENERKQREQQEAERKQREKAEAERKQREQQEAERKQREKAEAERKQREQQEAERKQREKAEAERKQREQQEAERKQREQAEAERKQREQQEAERKQREQAEAERKQREQAEAERKQREQQEAERKQREQAEAERKQHEQAEAERKQREQLEAERKQREQAEAERKQREQAEAERKQREQQEAERKQREKAEAERKQREQQEAERKQREKAEAERKQREKAEAERKQREKAEAERKRREQQEIERRQRERAAAEERARKQREAQNRNQSRPAPSLQSHTCPSNWQSARPGRPTYVRLQEGARSGCPTCTSRLNQVNNR